MKERMNLMGFPEAPDKEESIVEMSKDFISVYREGRKVFLEFLGAVSPINGRRAKFEVKVDDFRNYSMREVLEAFEEQWPPKKKEKVIGRGGVIVANDMTGKPMVVRRSDINKMEDGDSDGDFQEKIVTDKDIIFDPTSEEAIALKGEKVLGSDCIWDFESDAVKGVLGGIILDRKASGGKPFMLVLADGKKMNFIGIKPVPAPKIEPYCLARAEVRDRLMLKVYKSKDAKNYVEGLVHTFKCTNGSWTINGMSATRFLADFVWIDGTPCGEFPKEED